MYLSVCVHSWPLLHIAGGKRTASPTFQDSTLRFTSWPSDRHLECLQLHRRLCVCVCVCVCVCLCVCVCVCVCAMHTYFSSTSATATPNSSSSLACCLAVWLQWSLSVHGRCPAFFCLMVHWARWEPDKGREKLWPGGVMPAWLIESLWPLLLIRTYLRPENWGFPVLCQQLSEFFLKRETGIFHCVIHKRGISERREF